MPVIARKQNQRPYETCANFERFFYAGTNVVYFSPLIRSYRDVGRCYQVNDPVSEVVSDLLATDGGVIKLSGVDKIIRLVPFRNYVLVFATNGVWSITGVEGVFSASAISVSKITENGCQFRSTIVEAESSVAYFSTDAIQAIGFNEFGTLQAQDLSTERIRSFYVDNFSGKEAAGGYNPATKEIWWWVVEAEAPPFRPGGIQTNRGLILDLRSGGFYPQQTSTPRDFSTPLITDTEFYFVSGTASINQYAITLSESTDDELWTDFTSFPAYDAYMETGPETLGKAGNGKSIMESVFFFERTETQITGIQTYGEGGNQYNYVYDKPSACYLQLKWDYDGGIGGNKWVYQTPMQTAPGGLRQIYKPNVRGFIPEQLPDDLDDGNKVLSFRQRLRGSGRAVKMRFEAEQGKDMRMLGYSVAYTLKSRL